MRNFYSPPFAASMVSDATEATNPFFRESHSFICMVPKQSLWNPALWSHLEIITLCVRSANAYQKIVSMRPFIDADGHLVQSLVYVDLNSVNKVGFLLGS